MTIELAQYHLHTSVSYDLAYIVVAIKSCSRTLFKLSSFFPSIDPSPHIFLTIDQMNNITTNSPQVYSTISATNALKLCSFCRMKISHV